MRWRSAPDDYRTAEGFLDEVFSGVAGAPATHTADLVEALQRMGRDRLAAAGGRRGEPVWVGADPTNRSLAGETHVKIGHGRRYSDVPPIKGVYRGAASAELDASVTMTRLDPQASARA
jgi:hypothetical protein